MLPEQVAELRRRQYNATVAWLRKAHSDLLMVRVKPDFQIPPHKPGQYTSLGLGYWEPRCPSCQDEVVKPGDEQKLVRRAYSIGCPILDDGGRLLDAEQPQWLEFYIVLVRESEKSQPPALTPRLFMLREGDR